MNKFVKKLRNTNISRVIVFILMLIYAATMLAALVWLLFATLKENSELLPENNPNGLPSAFLISNYINAFSYMKIGNTDFLKMFFNSVWFSAGSALISGFVSAISGYIFSKYSFKGKRIIYVAFMIAMLLPMYGNFPAMYRLTRNIGIYNTPLYMLVGAAGYGNVMLIFMAGFDSLSWEYAEAAEIDGANDYYIFFRIMFPLIRPVFISLFLVGIIGAWNNYMSPIIYMPDLPTLSSGLYLFKERMQYSFDLPSYYAGVVMSFIPTLLLFIIFRETIMENVAMGGLKG